MSDEKLLTKEIAEQFLADEDSVDLSDFTAIEDDAAESLSRHQGDSLSLNGLTELPDAVAESLSKHQGTLWLGGLTELPDAAAESLSKHQGTLWLGGLTELPDAVAESLSKHQGILFLGGLTELPDAVAESLSKHQGILFLGGLTELPDAAAESLSKHQGTLCLDGLTELPDAVAESLSKHQGGLVLNGLKELSDTAAEYLSKHHGELLDLPDLRRLSSSSGHLALTQKWSTQEDVDLSYLEFLADEAAEILSTKKDGSLCLANIKFLSATAIEHLRNYEGDLDLDFDSVQGKKRFHVKHTRVVNEYTVYEIYAEDRESATNLVESWELEGDDDDKPFVILEEREHQFSAVDNVWEPDED